MAYRCRPTKVDKQTARQTARPRIATTCQVERAKAHEVLMQAVAEMTDATTAPQLCLGREPQVGTHVTDEVGYYAPFGYTIISIIVGLHVARDGTRVIATDVGQ